MSKRSNENENLENSSKKLNFNMSKKDETPLTPPQTPTSSNNKYDFNIWSESKDESVTKPIKIADLKVGVFMQRPLTFRVSFKSEKRGIKNGDMFVFYAMDCISEIQITVFPQQTTRFFDVLQKFNRTYELTNFNVKQESENFPIFIGEGVYISLLASSKIKEMNDDAVCIAVIAENWGEQIVGQNKSKRDLSITDDSKDCIIVTLWGSAYKNFDDSGTCVLIHIGVVNQYNGVKTISCAPNTLFWHNPDIAITTNLKSWFDEELKEFSNK